MGLLQGLALPFRGFSRSGATISAGMLTGATQGAGGAVQLRAGGGDYAGGDWARGDAAAARDPRRRRRRGAPVDLHGTVVVSLLGAVFAFLAGLVALKWLSNWLENGRWYLVRDLLPGGERGGVVAALWTTPSLIRDG